MKGKSFVLVAIALAGLALHGFADGFGATTVIVGRNTNGFETPVNQLITPAGTSVELPNIRPNALALSPDGKRLVTAGLTRRLLVINPATGTIVQQVRLPADDKIPPAGSVSSGILQPNEQAKLSFTGLVFSPDGSRI